MIRSTAILFRGDTKRPRKQHCGAGLWLHQASRGHVKIYSEVGEGTTIKLYLPRAHSVATEDHVDVARPVAGSKDESVLVVEDDPDVRTYSCETLAELGYNVVSAEKRRGQTS